MGQLSSLVLITLAIVCFYCSNNLKTFDPFEAQKQMALVDSLPAISTLASYTMKNSKLSNSSPSSISNHELFLQLFYVGLGFIDCWTAYCNQSFILSLLVA